MKKERKFKFSMPHAYVIMMTMVLISAILTWVLPAGQFDRAVDPALGRELVVPGSYHGVDANPIGPWAFCMSIFDLRPNTGYACNTAAQAAGCEAVPVSGIS